jgi:sulfotransferase
MKTIHFIAGLPRSGSTLLANILAQNPRFQATATSGILEILFLVRNAWDNVSEFRAMTNPEESEAAKLRTLRGILESFHGDNSRPVESSHGDNSRPVIFDKSRSWLAHLELAEAVLGRKAKALVPVRDIRDVLASFERLWRSNSATRQVPQEASQYLEFQTLEGRCNIWASANQPVGLAYNRIRDALHRGFRDRMHFVPFEQLTKDPEETMRQVYEFIAEPYFDHDFNHVEQVTQEDDRVFGFLGLHTIRNKVEPVPPQWPKILGDLGQRYVYMKIW